MRTVSGRSRRSAKGPRFALLNGQDGDGIWRTARKRHECEGRTWWDGEPEPPTHTPYIETGENHLEYCGNVYAYQAGPRLCAACAIAAGWSEAPQ